MGKHARVWCWPFRHVWGKWGDPFETTWAWAQYRVCGRCGIAHYRKARGL